MPLLNGIFIRFHQSQHALLDALLRPLVDMQSHIWIVSESVRQQPLLTMEVALKLAHVVGIAIAVATRTEDNCQRTVAPEVLTHTIDTRCQLRHVWLFIVMDNSRRWRLLGRRLLGDSRPRHGKHATCDAAIEHLAIRACRNFSIFSYSFFCRYGFW